MTAVMQLNQCCPTILQRSAHRYCQLFAAGLRFGSESDELNIEGGDFTEVHFGPGAGSFREGLLNVGTGMVADSKYMELQDAGAPS